MYRCVRVCVTWMHACTYVIGHVHVQVWLCACCMYACMHVCNWSYSCTGVCVCHMYACMYVCNWSYAYIHVYTCIVHTNSHIQLCACMHACTYIPGHISYRYCSKNDDTIQNDVDWSVRTECVHICIQFTYTWHAVYGYKWIFRGFFLKRAWKLLCIHVTYWMCVCVCVCDTECV